MASDCPPPPPSLRDRVYQLECHVRSLWQSAAWSQRTLRQQLQRRPPHISGGYPYQVRVAPDTWVTGQVARQRRVSSTIVPLTTAQYSGSVTRERVVSSTAVALGGGAGLTPYAGSVVRERQVSSTAAAWPSITYAGSVVRERQVSSTVVSTTTHSYAGSVVRQRVVTSLAGGTQLGTVSGMILMYGGPAAPPGWLVCNGASYSSSTYPYLYAVIGTTFGSSGAGTFWVPGFTGRAPIGPDPTGSVLPQYSPALGAAVGEAEHVLALGEMPAHAHPQSSQTLLDSGGTSTVGFTSVAATITLGGTTQSVGSGSPHNNVEPVLAVQFLIKT